MIRPFPRLSVLASAHLGRIPAARTLLLCVAGAGLAVVAGYLGAARSPVLVGALVVSVAGGALALRDSQLGVLGTMAIIVLLPFGVLPIRLGIAPTFLDLALVSVLAVWAARVAARREQMGRLPPSLALCIGTFLVVATVAFLLGSAGGQQARAFTKLVAAVLLFFPAFACFTRPRALALTLRMLLVLGALEAVIGVVLYLLPSGLSFRLLSSLRVLGYPADATVLRYLPDTERLRAIGTAVDPNMLGALLMVVAVIAISQWFAPGRIVSRYQLAAVTMVVGPCLLLTYSRGSWLGLVVGLSFAATLRYRRLWYALAAGAVATVLLPPSQRFLSHLVGGLYAQDRAAAMRLGEMANAYEIIRAHPWFGIGFGDPPTATLVPGVSNVYLTVAEQSGVIGLLAFLAAVGSVLLVAVSALVEASRRQAHERPGRAATNGSGDTVAQLSAGPGPLAITAANLAAARPQSVAGGGAAVDANGLLMSTTAAVVALLGAGMFDHHFVKFPHLIALFWLCAAAAAGAAVQQARAAGAAPG